MITLSKSGSTVTFTFDENSGYLQNGTIDVPVNSLALIIDESDMATFRKSASNDIFISARYEEFGMSKAELEAWYKANMVGSTGGGVDSGTVQTMIDESISGKAESVSAVSSAEYVSSSTTINFKNVDGDVISSIDASDFVIDGMIDDVRIETISGVSYLVIDFNTASGKEDIQIPLTDIFDPSNYYTKTEVDASLSGKADTTAVTEAISAATDDMATKTWVGEQGYLTEHQSLSAYSTTEEVNSAITEATSGKVDTSTFETYSGSVETALSGKQDTLSAGTNITISGNVISAEGGGKAIEAGRGISITTGETADTVSFNLPLSGGGSSNLSIVGGQNCTASNSYSFVFGQELEQKGGSGCALFGSSCKSNGSYTFAGGRLSEAKREAAFAYGFYVFAKNKYEHSVGYYNNSVSASTSFGNSGNTLFSVGNGTADDARHNAFEIRQNGDIYLSLNGQDVKLQDQLGGGISSGEVQTMIDESVSGKVDTSSVVTAVTSASTDSQVPSAKAVNDKLGGLSLVKLTQSAYDALSPNYDSNTLYVIVN